MKDLGLAAKVAELFTDSLSLVARQMLLAFYVIMYRIAMAEAFREVML